MHHLRSRAALTEGVAMQAIEEMDQALAAGRWGPLFAEETGDPVAAAVVHLGGDGMLLNSLSGDASTDVQLIVQWLSKRSTA